LVVKIFTLGNLKIKFRSCDEMASPDSFPVCKSGNKIIYAWAMNAAGLQFPKG